MVPVISIYSDRKVNQVGAFRSSKLKVPSNFEFFGKKRTKKWKINENEIFKKKCMKINSYMYKLKLQNLYMYIVCRYHIYNLSEFSDP